jgi:putative oxidoreductase
MSAGNTAPVRARGGLVRTILVWTATVLLAALFALAGSMKFVSEKAATQFAEFGYAYWFCILIGVIEVAGALALLVPRTSFYGAVALGVVMVGAVLTLLLHGPAAQAIFPLVFLALLAALAYARRPRFARRAQ